MNPLICAAVPDCRINDANMLRQIASFYSLHQFPSLVLMLFVCGVLPENWMIYLPHFFVDQNFLTRIRLFKLRSRVFGNFLVLSNFRIREKTKSDYLSEFERKCCRGYLKPILPQTSNFGSFRELLRLHNQTSCALSQTINIPSALIVSRFPALFTNLCQLISFRSKIKILRERFGWLHQSPSSNPQMFCSIIKMMIEAWDPSHRWMYNDPNLFCILLILLLLMDPSFFPEFRLDQIERVMRYILYGGDPSHFQTYLNVPFIFFLQRSNFYEKLKIKAPQYQYFASYFAALETMTLSDVLDGCGTFKNLSTFMNLSPHRMGLRKFQWNIPNTFEIFGNCFDSRSILFHRELIDDTHIIICIMMHHSFLEFYERFCLPLHLHFHQEPNFMMSMMSIDITYVPYKRIRDVVLMIFPPFLMKMGIDQTLAFVSNEGDRIHGPHLLLAYFQVMHLNPNSGDLTEAKKMEMISGRLREISSQDPRIILQEYTRMFEWAASNQLMPCLFSMFLVNMFCENVPKFLTELGLDLNAPPAYLSLSPVQSMRKLLERINIISKRLGMSQLTDFDSFVEQAAYNRRLPTGIEKYFRRVITDEIVPSSFKGPRLRDNLRLERRREIRPTLDDVISLLVELKLLGLK